MKVLVKTVTGKSVFEVNVEESGTVADLKQQLEKDYSVNSIVYKGKVLSDASASLTSVGIVENVTCVMVGKKNTAPAPAPAAEASKPAEEEPKKEEAAAPAAPTPDAPAAAASEAAASAAGAFVTGNELDETVEMIMAMGDWPKEKVIQALQAGYNNPDRAVDFLLSGHIPQVAPPQAPAAPAASGEPVAPEAAAPQATPVLNVPGIGEVTPQQIAAIMAILQQGREGQAPPSPEALQRFLAGLGQLMQTGVSGGARPAASPAAGGAAGAAPAGGESQLAQALAQIPELPQIRQAVAADPRMLERVMSTLREQDPNLFQLINDNQQEFLSILRNGLPGQQAAGSAPQVPPGAVVITEADRQAITRLQQLGFTEQQAAQAYLIADRNEELAANMLFDGGMNMDQD
eukprot:TRINITY_DN468_c3_g1_i1.p1 TRINITY_DN468_c3_g1~~TRINITY_DN468_c3_g1_i1.p1  ORF type:complete len:404 (+),score=140.35 TRINITY_DN468_c3_g1_i1:61-1272(+)